MTLKKDSNLIKKTIKLLLKTYDLIGIATIRKVELSSSTNRATLRKLLGFAGAGTKLIDIACKYSITKKWRYLSLCQTAKLLDLAVIT